MSKARNKNENVYEARDFGNLLGTEGFSDELLKDHFGLYEGYVEQVNDLSEKLANARKGDSPEVTELRRRFGWEWNGMRLHELYFEGLGGNGEPADSDLAGALKEQFGSFDKWRGEFKAFAGSRGVGWTILYRDPESDHLMNVWIDEHDMGHTASCTPLLVLDVWEHAFMTDYRTDRDAYIDAYFGAVDWRVVERRFRTSAARGRSAA